MTQIEKREYWTAQIEAYKASGQRVTEWCESNGLRPERLRYWKRRAVALREPRQEWIPVSIMEHNDCSNGITLRLGKITVEVDQATDMQLLCEVVKVLNAVC